METTKIVSSMQLHVYSQFDKQISRLAASAINDDRRCRSGREQEIEDGLAASKALNESRLHRPRHLMCLVLTLQNTPSRPSWIFGLKKFPKRIFPELFFWLLGVTFRFI